ncbi:hypothetical protein C1Y40_04374 [Mycobacterium talmoniae]|uniref:Uncharacterized protein n=1 Tax=Mycobacterium talmoniae TaxID=1858794 RepID=A0A2S8BFR8_9MYCO|nr:hypothetical protein C1Y40_04374 [Mycobacterium talmoniae]
MGSPLLYVRPNALYKSLKMVSIGEVVELAVVDEVVDADMDRLCNAFCTAEISWLVCELPAVLAAWPTAAACPASPAALVTGCGAVNGVTWVAVADWPAYPYIAAASCAHISP